MIAICNFLILGLETLGKRGHGNGEFLVETIQFIIEFVSVEVRAAWACRIGDMRRLTLAVEIDQSFNLHADLTILLTLCLEARHANRFVNPLELFGHPGIIHIPENVHQDRIHTCCGCQSRHAVSGFLPNQSLSGNERHGNNSVHVSCCIHGLADFRNSGFVHRTILLPGACPQVVKVTNRKPVDLVISGRTDAELFVEEIAKHLV